MKVGLEIQITLMDGATFILYNKKTIWILETYIVKVGLV
jgi:hypothetical protein